jgi:hypothetical protein
MSRFSDNPAFSGFEKTHSSVDVFGDTNNGHSVGRLTPTREITKSL